MTLKTRFRVGKIRYMNCLPFYHGLETSGELEFDYCEDVPAVLNAALREGRVDIAPVSSLEYLNHQSEYLLLPFIIGSQNFAGSVFLFSREKIENLNGAVIAVTRESLSSSILLKILLKKFFKFENTFVEADSNPDGMLGKFPAALVIGDDALFYEPKEFIYKYDLGELWKNRTGKPFCYAVWTVRRDFARHAPEEVAAFSVKLKKVLTRNLSDIEKTLNEARKMNLLDPRFPKTVAYLANLQYQLSLSMREGLELFYRAAHDLGLSPEPQSPEFFQKPAGEKL